ncbi:beta-carotene 15,15'-monooxygenase [Planococcus shixiaomingii]|uniref:beta-carotene 15,15'-monooxygenase n=1 Tax=Planococcus shixiaomingii TaxID=3058393 RepID=UPI0026350362|nr:beta-carotene 15,15'-monooxygenase [Planococcus sp. N022]WKA54127.1 beta-carotene 15,15'-monooxygenase [Planococcus sp. N022]
MLVRRQTNYSKWALLLLVLVLSSNLLLYRSPFSTIIIPDEAFWVVAGSLLDLAVVSPLLLLAAYRLSAKQFIGFIATGFIIARFLIPELYFEPFTFMFYIGIAFEALVLFAEIALLGLVFYHAPAIYRSVKQQNDSPLFALLPAVYQRIKPNLLISVLLSEALMFYYAFCTWKKKVPEKLTSISLHKNTSAIAFNVMLIHAIVIETIGIHWWLHEKSLILSIVLLLLNIYSVIYFIADIQAIRLNPVRIKDGKLYASLGLAKRIVVPLSFIRSIHWGQEPEKSALLFVANDLENAEPQVVINFKHPQQATLSFGMTKDVSQIALKVDDPEKLKALLEE